VERRGEAEESRGITVDDRTAAFPAPALALITGHLSLDTRHSPLGTTLKIKSIN
jgi:hypothetical protein